MNAILLDVPLQIETDKLILRAPLQAGEGNVVHKAIKDSIHRLQIPFHILKTKSLVG